MLALVSADRQSYDAYREMTGDRAEFLRKHSGSYIMISCMHLQSALLSVIHEKFFYAAGHYYSASRYFRLAEEKNEYQPGIAVLKATFDIINGSIPSEYAWLFRIPGMSVEDGLNELSDQADRSAGSRKLETCLLLMYAGILLDYELPVLSDHCPLPESFQDSNPLLVYVRALYDLKAGRSKELVAMFEGYEQSHDAHHFYFLDLVEGEARLNLLDAAAGENLEEFIRGYSGEHYVKLAWHKLSWHYFLNGDMEKYQHARKQVAQQGIAVVDADRQAFQEAADGELPNPALLRSRLLFDGGQYQEALQLLDDQPVLFSLCDSVELIYRKGRIYEGLGESDKAIDHYSGVLKKGSGMNWFFAPNSALHMGFLYEQAGDTVRALYYYDKCLEINQSSYKKSIAYRARQGQKRLEN